MTLRPKLAVIGVGSIGRHHARILGGMNEAQLVAVSDTDRRATSVAGLSHLPHYPDYRELLETQSLDGVVVATPSFLHAPIVADAIKRGLAVLVEKPIAASIAEAQALVDLAEQTGTLLAVGHVERFNPAVQMLKQRLGDHELGRLFAVAIRREGPFPERVSDVGVTVDLATHDLDVLGYLLAEPPEMLFAQVASRLHAAHEDFLTATLRFPHGVLATLQVNWLTPTKIRQVSVAGERGMFVVDYLTQDLTWFENGEAAGGWDALDTLRGVSEGRAVRYPIPRREPLAAELSGFVEALQGGIGSTVSGSDGVRTLTLALALLESAATDAVIFNPLDRGR